MIDHPQSIAPSPSLQFLCVVITLALAIAWPVMRWIAGRRSGEPRPQHAAARTAAAISGWLLVTGILAASGRLDDFEPFPPRVMPLLLLGIALVIALASSSYGRRMAQGLPLPWLVGYQGFRIAVEWMLHRASVEGVIGQQMTWSGLNFDVITGVTAIPLALWLWRRDPSRPTPRGLLWAWNLLGLGLLITIVTISVMSFPGPMKCFAGPPNVWITTVPFIWLPAVMVMSALMGHLLVARRLLHPPAPAR